MRHPFHTVVLLSAMACTVVAPVDAVDTTDDSGVGVDDENGSDDTFTMPDDTFVGAGSDSDAGQGGGSDSGDSSDSTSGGLDTFDTFDTAGCGAGEVLDCSGYGCSPASWLGDGACDSWLNCAANNQDGGDCTSGGTGGFDTFDTFDTAGCGVGEVLDCNGYGCSPASWLGDGMCDSWLNCAVHNQDGGDCGSGGTGGTGGTGGANPCPAGQVPDCSGSCADLSLLANGSCDAAFDCDAFGKDAADCGAFNACDPGEVPDCGTTGSASYDCSPARWLSDGNCDSWLNCETFGYDAGDCP